MSSSASDAPREFQGDWSMDLVWPEGLIEKSFDHSPFLPYDPHIGLYATEMGVAQPWHFTDWRDEGMSWKESCYLHAGLNPTATIRITGPEALDFLAANCVNSFANFPVGRGKHAIMCNDNGFVVAHGVLLRLGEEDFITYWLDPYITDRLEEGGYDAAAEDVTGKVFLFQLAGPRSLEVLEAATAEDLHDIKFMGHRPSNVDGHEITVLRMGMGGTLAYEVHGPVESARAVYSAFMKAGERFDIRRLGWGSYMLNHTENGFQQGEWHFVPAPYDGSDNQDAVPGRRMIGSLGPDIRERYCSPVDLGWSKMIKFDHDFRGRSALEKQVANPEHTTVTLVWNADDVVDVYASQLRDEDPYQFMEMPHDLGYFYSSEGVTPTKPTGCPGMARRLASPPDGCTARTPARSSRSQSSTSAAPSRAPKSRSCGVSPAPVRRRSVPSPRPSRTSI